MQKGNMRLNSYDIVMGGNQEVLLTTDEHRQSLITENQVQKKEAIQIWTASWS